MEENLMPDSENSKKTIEVPGLLDNDCVAWNMCGGSFMLGCWFGPCLLPLIQITKSVKNS